MNLSNSLELTQEEKDWLQEQWKQIKWLWNFYFISNYGKVKSTFTGKDKILKTSLNKWYECINITFRRKTYSYKIHRLVWIYFIDNPENKPEINHIDCNKENNNFSNLERVTSKENSRHQWNNWLTCRKFLNSASAIHRSLKWNTLRNLKRFQWITHRIYI